MLKKTTLISLILLLSTTIYAQDKVSFGASLMYNFPLNTIGVGIRSQIPVTNRITLTPDVKYAPKFNQIHELYAGLNVHLLLITSTKNISYQRSRVEPQKPNLYITAGAEYNQWFNYINSINSQAKEKNILPKIGLGTSFGSHITRFFAEIKYNFLWDEAYTEAGLLIYPGFIKLKKKNSCPVIH
ncbi:MAG: hypothetical protein ACOVO2_20415 [Emticicia sp.]|uniref:hypothetical protein n=1 Tax=Emticicia sp. TaxID=1930953 RepID=UPI003BA806DA